jgi:hypothetical protein
MAQMSGNSPTINGRRGPSRGPHECQEQPDCKRRALATDRLPYSRGLGHETSEPLARAVQLPLRVLEESDRLMRTRKITGIREDVRINAALWEMAAALAVNCFSMTSRPVARHLELWHKGRTRQPGGSKGIWLTMKSPSGIRPNHAC